MGKINIALATGGTGGHIFPAVALREELNKRGYNSFVITDSRYENYIKQNDSNCYVIPAASFNKSLLLKLIAPFKIIAGIIQAIKILKQHEIKLVIGFGGYPSFPSMVAAILLKIDIIIHEQNAVLGKTNRIFAYFAKYIATSYSHTIGIKQLNKIIVTGNPVREDFKIDVPYKLNEQINLFIVAGSQGAVLFSKVIPAAINNLPIALKNRLSIVQQVRKEEIDSVRSFYQQFNFKAEIASFFDDMPARIGNSQLVIARAGASTIAELSAIGRPAILVPLPQAIYNHQYLNAVQYAKSNCCLVLEQKDFTIVRLSNLLLETLSKPEILTNYAANAKSNFQDGAISLANIIEKLN